METTHQTKHEGWKIEVKWMPSWAKNSIYYEARLEDLYTDIDTAFETVEELSRVLKKPQSHFKIDYITIIATRDSFNNIISKEVI